MIKEYDTTTYNQVCAWVGTAVRLANEPMPITEFEKFMSENLGYRVKYIKEYHTHDKDNPNRVDLIFALHKDDVGNMVTDRLLKFNGDIKWYEDYIVNHKDVIPSDHIIYGVNWDGGE